MQPTRKNRIRVLIVDDDAVRRELTAQTLKIGGFDVLSMATGERALLTLRDERGHIDWLITKTEFPGLVCGWILADEFRTGDRERPVIFLSDRPTDMNRRSNLNIVISTHATILNVLDLLKSRNRCSGTTTTDGEARHWRAA